MIIQLFFLCLSIQLTPFYKLSLPKKHTINLFDGKINLYHGIERQMILDSQPNEFELDFEFDQILLQSYIPCNNENFCNIISHREIGPQTYKEYTYYYKRGQSFLGLKNIQFDNIFNEINDSQYLSEEFRYLIKKNEFDKSIVGLSPHSQLWKYWSKIYNFEKNILTASYSLNKNKGDLIFYNLDILNQSIGHQISIENKRFSLPVIFEIIKQGQEDHIKQTVCVSSKKNLFMRMSFEMVQKFKSIFCANEIYQCTHKQDLINKNSIEIFFVYSVTVDDDNFATYIQLGSQQFYQLNFNEEIEWLIETTENTECDVYLEQQFFNYFSFNVNYVQDQNELRFYFGQVNPQLYNKSTLFTRIMVRLFIISFMCLFLCTLISRFVIKRKIKENYRNFLDIKEEDQLIIELQKMCNLIKQKLIIQNEKNKQRIWRG